MRACVELPRLLGIDAARHAEQFGGDPSQRGANDPRAAFAPLSPHQRGHCGGEKVPGAVIQRLSRQHPGLAPVGRLDHGDPRGGLHQTVETGSVRVIDAPGAELGDDDPRVLPCECAGRESQALEGRGPVTQHDHIRGIQQLTQTIRVRVEQRRALAVTCVEVLPLGFGEMRRVDAQNIGAEKSKGSSAHGPGDHTGEIEDADARERRIHVGA